MRIRYCRGTRNTVADSLSRVSHGEPSSKKEKSDRDQGQRQIPFFTDWRVPEQPLRAESEPAPEPELEPVVEPVAEPEPADPEIDDLTKAFDGLDLHALDLDECPEMFMEDAVMHVKRLSDRAMIPHKEHDDNSGFDVACIEPFRIEPKEQALVPLGLALRAPQGMYLRVAPRSGLAKQGIDVLAGVVDRGFSGEVKVLLYNAGREAVEFKAGDQVAQLIPTQIAHPELQLVDSLERMDAELARVLRLLESQATGKHTLSEAEKRAISKYSWYQGSLLKKGWRCIATKNNQELLLREFHDTHSAMHPAIEKTYQALQDLFYWPQMYRGIEEYARTCDKCQRIKSSRQPNGGPLQPLEIPRRNWDSMCLDFVVGLPRTESENMAILVVVDRLSKMAHFIPTNEMVTAAEAAQLFYQSIYRLHGLPSSIVSDRDPLPHASICHELI